jgi:hypothetical protein
MRAVISSILMIFTTNAFAIDYTKNNHINVGVNTFYRDYSEILPPPKKSDENGFLYGIVLGYEHKAPEALFFILDLALSTGNTRYDGSLQSAYGEYRGPYKGFTANAFVNADSMLGYSFCINNRHLLTPFIGLGASSWLRSLDDADELYSWDYFSYGLQYDYNLRRNAQVGLRVKIMQMLEGTMELPDSVFRTFEDEVTLGNKTHFEVSTPIVYRRKPEGKNYWRLTPYYQYLPFGKSNEVNSYNPGVFVYEPSSHTHIAGLKLEYGFGF